VLEIVTVPMAECLHSEVFLPWAEAVEDQITQVALVVEAGAVEAVPVAAGVELLGKDMPAAPDTPAVSGMAPAVEEVRAESAKLAAETVVTAAQAQSTVSMVRLSVMPAVEEEGHTYLEPWVQALAEEEMRVTLEEETVITPPQIEVVVEEEVR
jgi:hypothetical protein